MPFVQVVDGNTLGYALLFCLARNSNLTNAVFSRSASRVDPGRRLQRLLIPEGLIRRSLGTLSSDTSLPVLFYFLVVQGRDNSSKRMVCSITSFGLTQNTSLPSTGVFYTTCSFTRTQRH